MLMPIDCTGVDWKCFETKTMCFTFLISSEPKDWEKKKNQDTVHCMLFKILIASHNAWKKKARLRGFVLSVRSLHSLTVRAHTVCVKNDSLASALCFDHWQWSWKIHFKTFRGRFFFKYFFLPATMQRKLKFEPSCCSHRPTHRCLGRCGERGGSGSLKGTEISWLHLRHWSSLPIAPLLSANQLSAFCCHSVSQTLSPGTDAATLLTAKQFPCKNSSV